MNIYADRGNLLLLERRCAWRGIGFEVTGGGPRRRRRPRRARPLLPRRRPGPRPAAVRPGPRRAPSATRCTPPPRRRASSSASAAAISCSGTPTSSATRSPRHRARRPAHRARGRAAADRQRRDRGRAAGLDGPRVLAGFENHGGRTHLGAGASSRSAACCAVTATPAVGPRGRAARHRDRDLPARPAAAEERVVRRLADRDRARPRRRPLRRSTTRFEDAAHASARRAAGV